MADTSIRTDAFGSAEQIIQGALQPSGGSAVELRIKDATSWEAVLFALRMFEQYVRLRQTSGV